MRYVTNPVTGALEYPSLAQLRRDGYRGDPVELPEEVLSLEGFLIPRECATAEEIDLATEQTNGGNHK